MRMRSEMQSFVSESQREAELEEKRRYRFLAEKHQMLYNTLLQFYSRVRRWCAGEQSRGSRQHGWSGGHAGRREPELSHPSGKGSICARTGQETISCCGVQADCTDWESMAGAEDGAHMRMVGCVSDERGKGDVGIYGRVTGTAGSLLQGAILDIRSCRALLSHSHKHNRRKTWSLI